MKNKKISNDLLSYFKKVINKKIFEDEYSLNFSDFFQKRFEFIKSKKQFFQIQVDPHYENFTLIEVLSDDMTFLTDVLLEYFKSRQILILFMQNLTLYTLRKEDKLLDFLMKQKEGYIKENYIILKLEILSPEIQKKTLKDLNQVLYELYLMNHDFYDMIHLLNQRIFLNTELEKEKKWLIENFVIMGFTSFKDNEYKNLLGIFKIHDIFELFLNELKKFKIERTNESIFVFEPEIKSNVKRYKPLQILIFQYDDERHLVIGTFASKGETSSRFLIPTIKKKLDTLMKKINFPFLGFQYREMYKISQIIPLGILFSRNIDLLKEMLFFFIENLYTYENQIRFIKDSDYKGVWIILIEINKYADTEFKKDFLEKENIKVDSFFKRNYLHLLFTFAFLKSDIYPLNEFYEIVKEKSNYFISSWYNSFLKALDRKYKNPSLIKQKKENYLKLIPKSFTNYLPAIIALDELEFLEKIDKSKKFYVRFSSAYHFNKKEIVLTLNIYSAFHFTLNEIIEVLQSASIEIETEISFLLPFKEGEKTINIFYVLNLSHMNQAFLGKIAFGLEEILNSIYSVDIYNSLLLKSNLDIREITFIKALTSYYYQTYKNYSRIYIQKFIIQNPLFAEKIVSFMHSRFSPNMESQKNKLSESIFEIQQMISQFKTISEQTISNHLLEILKSIVRTNFYLGLEEIAFKIKTRDLSFLSEPKPLFEIFVYSAKFEGIHIRNHFISRGGIRWSDRLDDYRTEIYGLMKTQIIKNSIIIPDGAKGGFIIKEKLPQNLLERKELVEKIYKKFIYNLIIITDNVINKKIISPKNIKAYDNKDPYLVVAADKGTATFSDLANEISLKMNFWLHDAFASGGKNGYDHKKQGITAKGAWESVKFHFKKLNKDPEKDIFTAVGIGDMSGDVFGNGMLLSRKIKLVAAFNHIHIFLDPNPDPEISYKERLRLFQEVKGWDAYNQSLISPGGGIYERNAAKIEISKEMQKVLQTDKQVATGEELIQMILKAPVDLIWNGGIGTYIKSSKESHSEVMDLANDAVRINANELRCKIIAEGGNLGLTMKGRIEAARNGVFLNTDFIDNSGGVNMSDYEVNTKILLNSLVEKSISDATKEKIIREIEPEVITKVLNNNLFNNLAISLEYLFLQESNNYYNDWIKFLYKQHIFSQNDHQDLQELDTSPQISLLLGATKVYFKNYFFDRHLKFDKHIASYFLSKYFPESFYKMFEKELFEHPLRDKIFISYTLNEIINNLGSLYFYEMHRNLEKDYSDIYMSSINFFYVTELSFLEIYNSYKNEPHETLLQNLKNFIKFYKSIYIFINNVKINQNSKKNFKNIYNEIFSYKKPENSKDLLNIIEYAVIYFFLNIKLDIREFLERIKILEVLRDHIINLKANSLEEKKFLFIINEKYFNLIKNISYRKIKKDKIEKAISFIQDYKKEPKNLIEVYNHLKKIEEKILR